MALPQSTQPIQLTPRNKWALISEGAFFLSALAFFDTNVLIPIFLEGLTGSRELVGLAATVRQVSFMLPTLLFAGLVHRIPDVRRFLIGLYYVRGLPIVAVAAALLLPGLSPSAVAVFFLVAMAMLMLTDGASQLPWVEVLHGAVPENRRGYVIGWIQASSGALALTVSLFITHMLERQTMKLEHLFSLLYFIAAVLLTLSAFGFSFVVVQPGQAPKEQGARLAWWGRIPQMLRDHPAFRRTLLLQALMGTGAMALPFYALYLRDAGTIPAAWIGVLNVTQVAGGIAGGFLLGWCSDRFGPAWTLRLATMIGVAVPVLAIAGGTLGSAGAPLALATFLLVGVGVNAWSPMLNYVMSIAPQAERPYFVATQNMNGLAISFLPALGGLLAAALPYTTVFGIVLLGQAAAIWAANRLARLASAQA